jgi:hypothetical protein
MMDSQLGGVPSQFFLSKLRNRSVLRSHDSLEAAVLVDSNHGASHSFNTGYWQAEFQKFMEAKMRPPANPFSKPPPVVEVRGKLFVLFPCCFQSNP